MLSCDVLGHETKPLMWPQDACAHCWRGGIALIHSDSSNDVYFSEGRSRWQREVSLAALWEALELILQKATFRNAGKVIY